MPIRKRVARDREGEVQLTVRVTGPTDVYRFAVGMLGMQTEFAAAGRKTLRSLREAIGRANYADLDDFHNGRHRITRGPGPKVVWFTLRGGRILHAVQGNRFTVSALVSTLCGRTGLVRERADDDTTTARCGYCVPRAEKLEQIP